MFLLQLSISIHSSSDCVTSALPFSWCPKNLRHTRRKHVVKESHIHGYFVSFIESQVKRYFVAGPFVKLASKLLEGTFSRLGAVRRRARESGACRRYQSSRCENWRLEQIEVWKVNRNHHHIPNSFTTESSPTCLRTIASPKRPTIKRWWLGSMLHLRTPWQGKYFCKNKYNCHYFQRKPFPGDLASRGEGRL